MTVHHIKWPSLCERHFEEEAKRLEGFDISEISRDSFFYPSKAFEPLNSPKVVLYFCQLIPETSEKICLDIFDVETIFRGDAETRMGRMMWALKINPSHPFALCTQPLHQNVPTATPLPPLLVVFSIITKFPSYTPSSSPYCHTSFWRRYGTIYNFIFSN